MLGRTYDDQNCSIARSLELVGERWTMLVLREAFTGRRRFDEMAEDLGIARNVLAARLQRLVDEGVLTKVRYQERPERFEYRLTEKGLDLWPVLMSLLYFGDRYYAPNGPPVVVRHKECGGTLDAHQTCERCGAKLTARDVRAHPGPGASVPVAVPG
ncbi:MAG TPA: helix-turn-helix domain-containing protein [Solirubrobacter sp.]|nr:helix-turn-helix domain-containing protein [Solirubrobacter sp.]